MGKMSMTAQGFNLKKVNLNTSVIKNLSYLRQ